VNTLWFFAGMLSTVQPASTRRGIRSVAQRQTKPWKEGSLIRWKFATTPSTFSRISSIARSTRNWSTPNTVVRWPCRATCGRRKSCAPTNCSNPANLSSAWICASFPRSWRSATCLLRTQRSSLWRQSPARRRPGAWARPLTSSAKPNRRTGLAANTELYEKSYRVGEEVVNLSSTECILYWARGARDAWTGKRPLVRSRQRRPDAEYGPMLHRRLCVTFSECICVHLLRRCFR